MRTLVTLLIILSANTAYAQLSPYNMQRGSTSQNVYEEAARMEQARAYPSPKSANVSAYNSDNGVYTNYNTNTHMLTNSNGAVCYNGRYGLECVYK